jgi:lambda family phage portal protein
VSEPVKLIYEDGREIPRAYINAVKAKAGGVDRRWVPPHAYEAGVPFSAEMGEWFPFNRSPDAEINWNGALIRARARDLVRNDGWASGIISRQAEAAIGTNFFPVPQPNWRALLKITGNVGFTTEWAAQYRQDVMAEWRLMADDPLMMGDADEMQSLGQQFYTAYRHKLIDGEALAVLQWMPERVGWGGARYATSLKLLDPDRLSNPFRRPDTHTMRGGVELSEGGAPVGYHIRRAHQWDVFDASESVIWDYYERRTAWGRPIVIHDLDRDRAEQHRGLGILTAVLGRFKALSKYDQNALQAAILRTVIGFFIKSPQDYEQVRAAMNGNEDEERLFLSGYQRMRASLGDHDISLGGVKLPVLGPGEDIAQAQFNGQADDFNVFEHTFLRGIAASTGESAEEVTKDYSQTNYSSARAALISVWRSIMRRRTNFTRGFCVPFYVAWLEEVHDRGRVTLPPGAPDFVSLRAAYAKARWIGPGQGWVDPVKERQGAVLGLDAGFDTLENVTANTGGEYWEDMLDQRQIEEAAMQARKLTLPDWAGGGNMADSATNVDQRPIPQ